MHLVLSIYDKAGKLVMGIPWDPSVELRPPNNFFLNRPSIISPTHFILSLYDKVEKLVMGNPLGTL